MTVHFATDHAGFELKESLKRYVASLGHEVKDHGAFAYDADDDYPGFVVEAARAVAADGTSRAIILGASGAGEAIVANRIAGVRAGTYYGGPLDIVRLMREHNDTNTLSLGARFLSEEQAHGAVRLWLNTPFSGELRHIRRNETLEQLTRP